MENKEKNEKLLNDIADHYGKNFDGNKIKGLRKAIIDHLRDGLYNNGEDSFIDRYVALELKRNNKEKDFDDKAYTEAKVHFRDFCTKSIRDAFKECGFTRSEIPGVETVRIDVARIIEKSLDIKVAAHFKV